MPLNMPGKACGMCWILLNEKASQRSDVAARSTTVSKQSSKCVTGQLSTVAPHQLLALLNPSKLKISAEPEGINSYLKCGGALPFVPSSPNQGGPQKSPKPPVVPKKRTLSLSLSRGASRGSRRTRRSRPT